MTERLKIWVNRNVDMTPGKLAAQAVHAALLHYGVHPGTAVVVLEASPNKVASMRTVVHDAGRTEIEPGTLTTGTDGVVDD